MLCIRWIFTRNPSLSHTTEKEEYRPCQVQFVVWFLFCLFPSRCQRHSWNSQTTDTSTTPETTNNWTLTKPTRPFTKLKQNCSTCSHRLTQQTPLTNQISIHTIAASIFSLLTTKAPLLKLFNTFLQYHVHRCMPAAKSSWQPTRNQSSKTCNVLMFRPCKYKAATLEAQTPSAPISHHSNT